MLDRTLGLWRNQWHMYFQVFAEPEDFWLQSTFLYSSLLISKFALEFFSFAFNRCASWSRLTSRMSIYMYPCPRTENISRGPQMLQHRWDSVYTFQPKYAKSRWSEVVKYASCYMNVQCHIPRRAPVSDYHLLLPSWAKNSDNFYQLNEQVGIVRAIRVIFLPKGGAIYPLLRVIAGGRWLILL